ncbi:hypothetical protein [Paenibacillus methanolicus]|uniref:Uncharacterized protein n=1 Tax=Paenibacillus methanolicus TaxID=582686 RepID=A0A5S5C7V7_9BACL|nr:hypothetical protein [Paenibacillus methanolicus]TYP74476.1 hypothetical protein BCM02_10520 [Paenibacillus methanolicus]
MSNRKQIQIHDGIEYGITEDGDEYWEAEIQHVDEQDGHITDLIAVKVIYDDELKELRTEVHYLAEGDEATPAAEPFIPEAKAKLLHAVNEELGTSFE